MPWRIAAPGMSWDLPPPARWVQSTVSCKARGRLELSRPSGPSSRCAGGGTGPRPLFRKVGSITNEKHMLRDDINNALKDAMKARDERRVSTLRLVNASLKNADIEARGQGKSQLGDDEILSVLQKMIKQRQESITLYEQGGRNELAQQERDEIAIISAYLPQQLSDDEARAAIAQAIT